MKRHRTCYSGLALENDRLKDSKEICVVVEAINIMGAGVLIIFNFVIYVATPTYKWEIFQFTYSRKGHAELLALSFGLGCHLRSSNSFILPTTFGD